MENYKKAVFGVTQQINAAGSDFAAMTIIYSKAVGVYIYYRGNCEFDYTVTESTPAEYKTEIMNALIRYRDEAVKERSVA